MKKGLFTVVGLVCCIFFFIGCSKIANTTNPSMSATIGSYNFIASATTPSTLDTQLVDTTRTLMITGYGSDRVHPFDKIVLAVNNYKGIAGVYSIVQGQAGAAYYHNGTLSIATGGVVSITSVSTTQINGYFRLTTSDNIVVDNGKFTVNLP